MRWSSRATCTCSAGAARLAKIGRGSGHRGLAERGREPSFRASPGRGFQSMSGKLSRQASSLAAVAVRQRIHGGEACQGSSRRGADRRNRQVVRAQPSSVSFIVAMCSAGKTAEQEVHSLVSPMHGAPQEPPAARIEIDDSAFIVMTRLCLARPAVSAQCTCRATVAEHAAKLRPCDPPFSIRCSPRPPASRASAQARQGCWRKLLRPGAEGSASRRASSISVPSAVRPHRPARSRPPELDSCPRRHRHRRGDRRQASPAAPPQQKRCPIASNASTIPAAHARLLPCLCRSSAAPAAARRDALRFGQPSTGSRDAPQIVHPDHIVCAPMNSPSCR